MKQHRVISLFLLLSALLCPTYTVTLGDFYLVTSSLRFPWGSIFLPSGNITLSLPLDTIASILLCTGIVLAIIIWLNLHMTHRKLVWLTVILSFVLEIVTPIYFWTISVIDEPFTYVSVDPYPIPATLTLLYVAYTTLKSRGVDRPETHLEVNEEEVSLN